MLRSQERWELQQQVLTQQKTRQAPFDPTCRLQLQPMSDTPLLSVALFIVGELRGFLPDGWRGFERHVVRVLRREAANVDTLKSGSCRGRTPTRERNHSIRFIRTSKGSLSRTTTGCPACRQLSAGRCQLAGYRLARCCAVPT